MKSYRVHGSLEGDSLSVCLPLPLARLLGLSRGSRVEWALPERGRGLLLRPILKESGKAHETES